MREITINQNDAGQRLDRFVSKALPLLPPALLQKYIRLKRIKVNGKGSARDTRLQPGDRLQLYIKDEFFDAPAPENAFLRLYHPKLDIVYEDENILLADKRPGISVHPDETEQYNTLLTHIRWWGGEWVPRASTPSPALCNDRPETPRVRYLPQKRGMRFVSSTKRSRPQIKYYLFVRARETFAPRGEGLDRAFCARERPKKQVTVSTKPLRRRKSAATCLSRMRRTRGFALPGLNANSDHGTNRHPDSGNCRGRGPPRTLGERENTEGESEGNKKVRP